MIICPKCKIPEGMGVGYNIARNVCYTCGYSGPPEQTEPSETPEAKAAKHVKKSD